jgi:valyl-tRNA synthetase
MESTEFVARNEADKVIEEKFNQVSAQIQKNIEEYRLDFAMNEVYEFFWGEFCDKYIEECKTSGETANLHPMLKKILVLMHPFCPFITEEINELVFKDGSLMKLK